MCLPPQLHFRLPEFHLGVFASPEHIGPSISWPPKTCAKLLIHSQPLFPEAWGWNTSRDYEILQMYCVFLRHNYSKQVVWENTCFVDVLWTHICTCALSLMALSKTFYFYHYIFAVHSDYLHDGDWAQVRSKSWFFFLSLALFSLLPLPSPLLVLSYSVLLPFTLSMSQGWVWWEFKVA